MSRRHPVVQWFAELLLCLVALGIVQLIHGSLPLVPWFGGVVTGFILLAIREKSGAIARPWLGWATEYPDEGSVAVDATDEADAQRQVRRWLSADDDPAAPMETTVRPATADDIDTLQERIEDAVRGGGAA